MRRWVNNTREYNRFVLPLYNTMKASYIMF